MNELWKDIPNYEGIYQISNLRKIKRLKRMNKGKLLHEKEMKFSKNGNYDVVCLTKDGKTKNHYVDKLMFEIFGI